MTAPSDTHKGIRLETPSNYRIRVQGHIGESYANRMGRMIITTAFTADGKPITILVGNIADQRTLSDILNILYDLHLPLLSVEKLTTENRET